MTRLRPASASAVALSSVGIGMVVVGTVLNDRSASSPDGADIGAGLLILAGALILLGAVVTALVVAVQSLRSPR